MIRLSREQRALGAEHARWAQSIARAWAMICGMEYYLDDLRATALEALSKSAFKFDPSRNVPFRGFAWRGIVGAVVNAIKDQAREQRFEVALDAAAFFTEEDPASSDTDEERIAQIDGVTADAMDAFVLACGAQEDRMNGEAGLLEREAHAELKQAIARLPPEDRRLIQLRYWDELPWKDVAERLGLPERTAQDHEQKIRRHLRAALASGCPPAGHPPPRRQVEPHTYG
jgi:RNA polymerase sigma factor (sigma-70 family)